MVKKQTPVRVQAARYLSVVCAALGLLTLVVPDWIEVVTRYDPDHHNGAVEAIVVVAFFLAAVVAGGYAVLESRRMVPRHGAD